MRTTIAYLGGQFISCLDEDSMIQFSGFLFSYKVVHNDLIHMSHARSRQ